MQQVTVAPEVPTALPVIDDTRLPLSKQPNLWERIAGKVREKHYSLATERTYVMWAKKFVLWSGKRHPKDMGAAEVTAYLNHLAVDREVSASTQNQALSALLFLYKEVLGTELPWLDDLTRAKRSKHIPAVLSVGEMQRLLSHTSGTPGPNWAQARDYNLAIHPLDAHLEYGPLSSSLRESVINYAHEEQSKLIAAKYACGALGIDAFMVFRSSADTIEELDMFLLFCAELLADEGL